MYEINFDLAIENALKLQREIEEPVKIWDSPDKCDLDAKQTVLSMFYGMIEDKDIELINNEDNNNNPTALIDLIFDLYYYSSNTPIHHYVEIKQRSKPLGTYKDEMFEEHKLNILKSKVSKDSKVYIITIYPNNDFLVWNVALLKDSDIRKGKSFQTYHTSYTLSENETPHYINKIYLDYNSDAVVYKGNFNNTYLS